MIPSSENQFLRPDKFWKDIGLRANQTVAHLGCGVGFFLSPAAAIVGSKGHVIGVDIRDDILQEATSRAKRDGYEDIVTTIRADLEKGPSNSIKPNSSDWTLVTNILSQADPSKILLAAKDVTKTGGKIIIIEWSVSQATIGPPIDMRISRDQIINITSELNLKLDKEFTPSPYHYGLFIEV
jgi:ubiquinone/menaquinone biosynthesis C-methylase UbiE